MSTTDAEPRLVLFDGHGIIHRAYWGNRDHPLSVRHTGEVVTAVFGFANTLLSVLDKLRPTHVAVTMDTGVPTFRHVKDGTYKAHRPEMPSDLRSQIARVRELIQAFNIPIYEADGFEADDVLGTLAAQAVEQGITTYLVTLDSDILQLVRPGVFCFMYRLFQRDIVTYDVQGVIERYGVPPERIPDLKGLKGDTSDNIPGVPGIGEKTAVKLLQAFGSVDGIFEHLDEVQPAKTRELLRQHEEQARFSREMATIVTDAPVTLDLERCRTADFDAGKVEDLFYTLEFRSLMGRLSDLVKRSDGERRRQQQPDAVPVAYRTIYTLAELDEAIAAVRRTGRMAFDTETTSTNAMSAGLVGISISWEPGQACYIPVGHLPELDSPEQLPVNAVIERLQPLFSDSAIEKIAHNAKYDMEVLANAGLRVERIDSDTMIAAYLLGDRDIGLKSLAHDLLGVQMTPISALIGTGSKQITMAQVP
ncbi:MAG TPA: 5'-3' exonuclease H3TH domain-containing protein, partial [Dehalococcoidia bacterium]|nr:5'-3' exonuclease H3TH domain-containing protein [Dehalococcoidia bacterium]